jgi:hypothetical protein
LPGALLNGWPDHLPDWVFWLCVVVMPALFTIRMLWQMYGPVSRPPPTRMAHEEVIAVASAAIKRERPAFDGHLNVAEWPRPINNMTWTIHEVKIGSWWVAQIDDVTGEVRDVRHQGVR